MGSSRGHWDGDTLIVETTNFNGRNPFRGSSEHMRLVERFKRIDEDTIIYRFTVDDPATWTRPWSAELPDEENDRPVVRARLPRGELRVV